MKQHDANKINDDKSKINCDIFCPVSSTISILQGKWTLMILRDLLSGKKRFGELMKSIGGVNPKTLSVRLKELQDAGIIQRTFFPEVPPRVEYQLTPKGEELGELIGTMAKWGTRWKDENVALLKGREEEKRSPTPRRGQAVAAQA